MSGHRDQFREVQTALRVPATGIPNDETRHAFSTLWAEALEEYRASQSDEAPEPVAAGIVIDAADWIVGGNRDPIPGGFTFKPECLVIHFTSGASAKSSIESMRDHGLSAHVVIDRDGTIYQCRPFTTKCAHAGESRWVNPRTHEHRAMLNSYGIGIEIANAGDDEALAKRQTHLPLVTASHRNEPGRPQRWEAYPAAQLSAVFALSQALVRKYHLDDITGHDCIAPERKNDPGPAFPMEELRTACGFSGLPAVHEA